MRLNIEEIRKEPLAKQRLAYNCYSESWWATLEDVWSELQGKWGKKIRW